MPIDPTLTVQGYCNLLAKSRLMTTDDVKAIYRRWRDEKDGNIDDPDSFRRYLVKQQLLTDYQSMLLLRGNTDGFFLDQYRILDMIGKGRMAGVYKAVHNLGQVVAIKVLSPSKARDPQILARFQREARLLISLDHPNIVRAFQVGESGGRHYFVMENLEGDTLEEVLERRKKLPINEAIRITWQTLLGLQHLQDRGLIHRDLKPANLMLVPNPGHSLRESTLKATVRILDIGLGREVFDENEKITADMDLTGENVLLGTPDYLSPEQARDARSADIRTDVYSLGAVLFHMLTGQPPYPETNLMTQLIRHSQESIPLLRKFLPAVPDGLQNVLERMMAKDPANRYTPADAAQALKIFLMNTPEVAPPPTTLPAYVQWLANSGSVDGLVAAAVSPPVAKALPAVPPSTMPQTSMFPTPDVATWNAPPPVARPFADPGSQNYAVPPQSAALPAEPVTIDDDEYEVEVVTINAPLPPMLPPPPPPRRRNPDDEEEEARSLLELDRRDFIMLGAGASGVLMAIMAGYGLASLVREKDPLLKDADPNKDEPEPKKSE